MHTADPPPPPKKFTLRPGSIGANGYPNSRFPALVHMAAHTPTAPQARVVPPSPLGGSVGGMRTGGADGSGLQRRPGPHSHHYSRPSPHTPRGARPHKTLLPRAARTCRLT